MDEDVKDRFQEQDIGFVKYLLIQERRNRRRWITLVRA